MSNLPAGERNPIRRLTQEERAKRARKAKRRDVATNIAAGALVVAGVVAAIGAIFAFGGLIFYLAWNLGVVNLAAAAGGSVGTINFWTAIGGSLAVGLLSRIFRRTPAASVEAKA